MNFPREMNVSETFLNSAVQLNNVESFNQFAFKIYLNFPECKYMVSTRYGDSCFNLTLCAECVGSDNVLLS